MFLKSDGFDGFDGTGAGAHSDSPMGSFNVQWLPIGRPPRTERARGANSEAYGPGPGSWAHEPGPWTPGLWAWPGPWARPMGPGPWPGPMGQIHGPHGSGPMGLAQGMGQIVFRERCPILAADALNMNSNTATHFLQFLLISYKRRSRAKKERKKNTKHEDIHPTRADTNSTQTHLWNNCSKTKKTTLGKKN